MREHEPFGGNGRFTIARRLGMGGMGVVYEAYDRQRQVKVALKTLRSASAAAVLRFKREFRALHDIQHPNLVSLGELHEERGTWFFTMELVDGVGFMEYLRPGTPKPLGDGDPTALDATAGPAEPQPRVRARLRYDERRLRTGLAQLVRGLSALHSAGKIHRDVKPSNIMVGEGERVVLLDFGLVTEPDPSDSLTGDDAVGTAIYMAPEQAVGHAVDVRADWYSVGVLLYEVLVGAPPFAGNNLKVLIDKQRVMPPSPRSIDPEVPRDLDEICSALLHIDPRRRPSGDLILARLGVQERPSITRMAPLARASMHTHTQLLVGRDAELAQLERALADTRAGRQVSVYVNGESGIGKTTLVRTFAANAAADERVLVLNGRCYERDAVPFKALDGVIDALSRTLQKLPKVAACALVPHRASLLLQVFPVLRHVDALAEAPAHTVVDPQELRKLVFGAMRELFARIAERYTLVVAIDDLQWADADGLALLEEILRPPDAPPVLLLATWRDPEAKTGLRERLGGLPGDVRHIALSHLAQRDAAELARALFVRASDSGMAACGDAEAIAREAAGHPLFIDELVRHSVLVLGETNPDDTVRPVRLDDVLGRRIARLEPQARAVLELVALAGTPLEQETAARALGMNTEALHRQATVLRAMNLVRTTGTSGMDTMECYHDRVRTSVLERLGAEERVVRHRELARALDASGRADTEALVEHYAGARELGKAGQCAVRAAQAAERALAFERAARLYQLALALLPEDDPTRRSLPIAIGDALTNAGRGAEAAQAYNAAALSASAVDAVELRRRAAQQLLVTGHIDEGVVAMRGVLANEGIPYPETPTRAVRSIIWRRAKLWLGGMRFRERDESLVTARELSRLDVCINLGMSLATADSIRGHFFNVHALLLALRAGEPYRLALALTTEAIYRSALGERPRAQAEVLLATADRLAQRSGKPHAQIFTIVARGQAAFLSGKFRSAVELCGRAETLLRERCLGAEWEATTTRLWHARSLVYVGELEALANTMPGILRECVARSDRFGATSLAVSIMPTLHLVADQPERARAELDEAVARWSKAGFHLQHYYAGLSQVMVSLYEGRARDAAERIERLLAAVKGAHMDRMQIVRVTMLELQARTLLADGTTDERGLARVARLADQLQKERFPISAALAQQLRAQLAWRRGDKEMARRELESAVRGFEAVDLTLHAAAARQHLGRMVQGAEGAEWAESAERFMKAQKVRRGERIAGMMAPGFGV